MEELPTKEEKIQIIESHIRNLQYNKYNVTISLLAENAVTNPNVQQTESYEEQLVAIQEKEAALEAELINVQNS